MTFLVNYVRSGFTLHWLLSCTESFVLLSATYAVVRSWRLSGKEVLLTRWRNTLRSWLVMPARSGIPVLRSVAAKLLARSSTTLTRIDPRGAARYASIIFAFASCAILLAVAYHSKPTIEYLKNVQVIQRINDYDFRYQVVDPDTREWNEFIWKGCRDYVPTHEIQAGATILWVKYVEDKQESCQEIGWDNLGYKLWRDENDHPIIATFTHAGQTTSSVTSSATAP
jgi:hypothetical protein